MIEVTGLFVRLVRGRGGGGGGGGGGGVRVRLLRLVVFGGEKTDDGGRGGGGGAGVRLLRLVVFGEKTDDDGRSLLSLQFHLYTLFLNDLIDLGVGGEEADDDLAVRLDVREDEAPPLSLTPDLLIVVTSVPTRTLGAAVPDATAPVAPDQTVHRTYVHGPVVKTQVGAVIGSGSKKKRKKWWLIKENEKKKKKGSVFLPSMRAERVEEKKSFFFSSIYVL